MPNEEPEEQTNEKRAGRGGVKGGETPADEGGEREVQSMENPDDPEHDRPIQRERREQEGGDPRVGRGGAPIPATENEDLEDAGDGAVAGRV